MPLDPNRHGEPLMPGDVVRVRIGENDYYEASIIDIIENDNGDAESCKIWMHARHKNGRKVRLPDHPKTWVSVEDLDDVLEYTSRDFDDE